jgi:hypothetical protein
VGAAPAYPSAIGAIAPPLTDANGPGAGSSGGSLWLAQDPSKRWTEIFFLVYSFFWITWALCILVPFQLYEVRAPPRAQ